MKREAEDFEAVLKKYNDNKEESETFNAGSSTPYAVKIKGNIIGEALRYFHKQIADAEAGVGVYTRSAEATDAVKKCLKIDLVDRTKSRKKVQVEKQTDFFSIEKAVCVAVHMMIDSALAPAVGGVRTSKKGSDKRYKAKPTKTMLAEKIGESVMRQVCIEMLRHYDKKWFNETNTKAKRRNKDVLPSSHYYYHYFLSDAARKRNAEMKEEGVSDADLAEAYGFVLWTPEQMKHVGLWLLNGIYTSNPGVFEFKPTVKRSKEEFVFFSEFISQHIKDWEKEQADYIYGQLPMIVPPIPNEKGQLRGWISPASHWKVKSHKADFIQSDQHLAVLNALQAVPYQINPFVWEVMKHCRHRRITLGSFNYYERKDDSELTRPSQRVGISQVDEAECDYQWNQMVKSKDPETVKMVKRAKAQSEHEKGVDNSQFVWNAPSRYIYSQIEKCANYDEIYFPTAYGPRGRLYFRTGYLNPQGEDHAKAILRYARPTKIDTRTEFWLQVELANAAGLDKKSYEERVDWVVANLASIKLVATMMDDDGDLNGALSFLETIPDCWVFLAAAEEYYNVCITKKRSYTQLRVGIDATAQAGQIISGWRKSAEGAMKTNCLESATPSDVYLELWKKVIDACAHSSDGNLRNSLVKDWNKYKFGRKAMKAVMMVAQYGADKSCMCRDLHLKNKEFARQYRLNPDEQRLVNKQLVKCVDKVASVGAMVEWCRHVATATYNTGKKTLTLPCLAPEIGSAASRVEMKYPVFKPHEIRTFAAGSAKITGKFNHNVPTDEIDLNRWCKAITANWVHSADATLLCRALDGWKFNFTTIHDCFQTSPGVAVDLLFERLRQAYYDIITWDNWTAIVEANGLVIDDGTLTDDERQQANVVPPPPIVGTLDPSAVLESVYMFT